MIYLDYIQGFFPGKGDRFGVAEKARLKASGMLSLDKVSGFFPGKGDKFGQKTRVAKLVEDVMEYLREDEPFVLENEYNIKMGTSRQLGDNIVSVSLPIDKTCLPDCIGTKDKRKICYHCYGKLDSAGEYGLNSKKAIAGREKNYAHYNESAIKFFSELDLILSRKKDIRHLRYFIVGDIPDSLFLELALDLAKGRKEFRFWMPTLKANLLEDTIRKGILDNLTIRLSSPFIDQVAPISSKLHKYGVRRSAAFKRGIPKGIFPCPANTGKKCSECYACFNRKIDVVGYALREKE